MYQQEKIEKVALIGLGAIGCYLASGLQTVLGDRLRVIAGGSRAERLSRGVEINGRLYHFHLVDPADDCGGDYPQLAIIITKSTGLEQALKDIKNQIGPHTIVMAPLNGVDKEEKVAAVYGRDNLIYSLTKVSVVMKDGKASFDSAVAQMEFGEKRNGEELTPRVRAVKELFEAAGIRAVVPADMERAIWYKYMCNVSENQSCALLGIPFGAFRVSEEANVIREGLMREVVAVAQKKGICLTEEDIRHQHRVVCRIAPQNKPSTLQDIEAGRLTEVAMFGGAMMRYGSELGIPVPLNTLCYNAIRVLEQKNEGRFRF